MRADYRIAVVICALGVMLGTVSAAGGDRSKPTTHTVTIEGMKFEPETLTVAVGETVVWVNKDLVAHTATSSEAGIFDSKLIAPGKSWKLTVRKKGDFPYKCTYHPTMTATLHVQ
jgi:plastocyanin